MSKQKVSNALFIVWAGGAALVSYALVYALRKPFTAATFEGLEFLGMDDELARMKREVADRMTAAGACHVLDTLSELPAYIDELNRRMNA